MPMIELSDEDMALLDVARKAGGAEAIDYAMRAKALHDTLYTHKDTAVEYQRQIKKVYPNAKVAADVAAPYVERIDAVDKKLNDYLEAQAKEKEDAAKAAAQGDFDSSWNGVVKDYELTEEGQEKLLNFMKAERLANPEAAALLYYKRNPAPPAPITPSSIAPQGWAKDMGLLHAEDDTSSKLLVSNPDAWADQEAAAVLNEVRRQAA